MKTVVLFNKKESEISQRDIRMKINNDKCNSIWQYIWLP
jgi:hypothetical protein